MLPSYLIIGGKRCGSTSMQRYLTQHPAIAAPNAGKGSHYFDVNYARGWLWFRTHFPTLAYRSYVRRARGIELITGEASPYYVYHPLALARIKASLPDVKLILLVRDPVERAYSQHTYESRLGYEDLDMTAALDAEPGRLAGETERLLADPGYQSFHHRHHAYLARGRYADQIARVHELFAPEQLLVIQSEAVFNDPVPQMNRIYDFLGLERIAPTSYKTFKATAASPNVPAAIRERLAAYYAAPNQRLFEMLGVTFPWTSSRP